MYFLLPILNKIAKKKGTIYLLAVNPTLYLYDN